MPIDKENITTMPFILADNEGTVFGWAVLDAYTEDVLGFVKICPSGIFEAHRFNVTEDKETFGAAVQWIYERSLQ